MKLTWKELVQHLLFKNRQLNKPAAMDLADDIMSGKAGQDVLDRYGLSASQVSAMQRKGRQRQEQHTDAAKLRETARILRQQADHLESMARSLEED